MAHPRVQFWFLHPPAPPPALKVDLLHSPPHFSRSFCLSNLIPPVCLYFPEMNCFASAITSAMSWQNIFVSVVELPSHSPSYLSMTPAKFTTIGSSERRRGEKINSRANGNHTSALLRKAQAVMPDINHLVFSLVRGLFIVQPSFTNSMRSRIIYHFPCMG